MIEKGYIIFRRTLESGLMLAITLRHPASGNLYSTLSYDFRVSHSMISKLVSKLCRTIVDKNIDERMVNTSPSDILQAQTASPTIIKLFAVLLALVDADYKSLWVDVGGMGHNQDTH